MFSNQPEVLYTTSVLEDGIITISSSDNALKLFYLGALGHSVGLIQKVMWRKFECNEYIIPMNPEASLRI